MTDEEYGLSIRNTRDSEKWVAELLFKKLSFKTRKHCPSKTAQTAPGDAAKSRSVGAKTAQFGKMRKLHDL